jgi:alanine racemase
MVKYRNTWAEINVEAIGYNIQQLQSLLPRAHKMMGVIKADGYGHGSVQVAHVLMDHGVDFLMVALFDEAIKLRESGITIPILVVGRVEPHYAHIAATYDITLSVFQMDWVEKVRELHFEKPLEVHLEFETGMNRTGICSEADVEAIITEIKALEQVRITGAYTHFATADEKDSPHYFAQRDRYQSMLHTLTDLYDGELLTHMGNSAAGIQFSSDMLHYTRFGIALYGIYPSRDIKALGNANLRQAMSLYSELIQVKHVQVGEFVSYGATYTVEEEAWIGTVPIGYADGWRRQLQGFHVLVDGKKCPIVGRICMDSMMIKLDKAYEVGERVTLIGEDQGAFISMDDVAEYVQTIGYEIPVMLTSRVPREYK